ERLTAALRHNLDRQTAVEIGRRGLPLLKRGLLGGEQGIDERLVLEPRHRTIDVVGAGAGRTRLVVARLPPREGRVDGVKMDDRRDGIEEGKLSLAGQPLDV